MKIAITGHSAGIGQALATIYQSRGHEIVGLSRRNGHNIRITPKVAGMIEPCDMFINNAQVGFAQTELLFEMAKRWQNTGKHIINISTMMTQHPVPTIPGLGMVEYRTQKIALEEAVKQLRHQGLGIKLTIVRPGKINTQGDGGTDPAIWAQDLVDILNKNLPIPDISLL
jgi:NAD(P)-dependent dehydrogenase (short-subunit alcohol dehydrogenase family)